jgi:beta-fructofuranosidase
VSVHRDLRPRFHVRSASSWINDPNGPIFWNDAYHLFFQHNPLGLDWGPPTWGHAVSADLVHWTVLGDALTPTRGGPDAGGCWSGCTVAHAGRVYAFYTGFGGSLTDPPVCAAVSDGDLTEWRKVPDPVIPAPPPGLHPVTFRDPHVLRHGDGWLCVVGAGTAGACGMALLYASSDLLSWDYVGPLYERDCSVTDLVFTGDMWECPQFFSLGNQHLLGVSVAHQNRLEHAGYFLGDFDGRRFTPTSAGRLDFGPDYYAATSMSDPAGRRLMWGWSWEALTDSARRARGLAGCLTLPREVSLQDGQLLSRPVEELAKLRRSHVGHYTGDLLDRVPVTLVPDAGTGFDVGVTLTPHRAARVELDLCASPYGLERTVVFLDVAAGSVGLDTAASTLSTEARTGVYSASLDLQPQRAVDVRVVGDGCILEVFVDGRPFTGRVYPTREDSRSIRLRAYGGAARVARAEVWTVTERAVRFPHDQRSEEPPA